MAKYTPLKLFLAGLPASQKEITLTFSRIEEILGDKLPKSASLHRAWWSNEIDGQHVEAQSWLDAGWRVDSVDQTRNWIRFIRK